MNVNNSSTIAPNSTATSKAVERPVKAKEPEAQEPTQEIVKQPEVETIEKVQQEERIANELRNERLSEESEEEVKEKVETAVETIRGFIQENQRSLDFDIVHESKRVIISVIDRQTNEVIRQIPPEDAVELADRIQRGDDLSSSGILLEGKA